MASETCLVKVGYEHGNGECLVGFQDSAVYSIGISVNCCNRKSTNRTKSSTNRMVGRFSGLVRDFLLVSRAVMRLFASTNSGMTALQYAKETE
jgi:hypothetical protein